MVVNRTVVGAHYGLGSWLAQRVTAVVMVLYTVVMLVFFLRAGPMDYAAWKALFAGSWMRVGTLIFAVGLAWHAWVGMRDILMDYARPDSLRFALQVATLLLIAIYLGWAVQILWR